MRRFWNFVQHNNAVPIALFLLFGGAGVSLAATPQVQQAVISSQDTVQQVDNTYIVSTDLANYNFNLHVTNVTEDTDSYYVSYEYQTINVVDYVWQQQTVDKNMTVSKKELEGKDLGVFVAKQLGEEMTQQLAYLTQVQEQERAKGAQAKVVATTYSGLIGKMLSPSEKTFPGYVPVVTPPPVDSSASAAAALAVGGGETHIALPPAPSPQDIQAIVNAAVQAALSQQAASSTPSSPPLTNPDAPVITIQGANPARIALGSSYNDLGATVTDDKDQNLGIHTFVNGTEVQQVSLDTSSTTLYTITYRATDSDGNTSEASRSVVVYDPNASSTPPPADTGSTGTTTASSTPPADTGSSGGTGTTTPPSDTSSTPPANTGGSASSTPSTPPDTSASSTPPAASPAASSTPAAAASSATTTGQ